mgnify:CR=1 FL=1
MFNGLDIATLILIVVGLIGGLFCLAYLLRFHTRADKTREEHLPLNIR